MSTIKVTNIDPPSAGGAVNVNGVAMPNAGPLSNRNLIVNGAMAVAQRGTTSASDSYQTVDRFKTLTTAIVCTQSQQALSSGSPYDEGFRYFYRQNNDTPSTAANSRRVVQTILEAQDIASSGWNYTSSSSFVTLSFWVRSSVAQTFYGHVKTEDGTAQNYPFSFALSADTWTKVTKQIPGNSNLQFDNDNAAGLEIDIAPFYGTNYTDSGVTVDAWAAYASGTRTPDNTSTWANTTNATFDLTGVQLEVGSQATPFEHRSYGNELARCQRYYQRFYPNAGGNRTGVGYAASGTQAYIVMPFPVTMRAAPTALEQSGTAGDYSIANATSTTCNGVPLYANANTDSALVAMGVASGLTTGQAVTARYVNTNGFFGFTAEL